LIDRDLIAVFVLKIALIFLLVEEEIVLGGVVGPDVFDRFVDFTRTYCIVDEFIFRCGPGGIFEFRCQFKCPIHDSVKFYLSEFSGKTRLFLTGMQR